MTTASATVQPRYRTGLLLTVAVTFVVASGDGLAGVALALRAFGTSHAGWAVAVVFLAITAPVVLFAPVAGAVLDHLPLRGTLVGAAAWMVAVAVALSQVRGVAITLALATGFGVGTALLQPGLGALVPRLVGTESITKANGYLQAATWSGITMGPLLAGSLAAVAGTGAALEADAVAYGLGAVVLALVPMRSFAPSGETGEGTMWKRVSAGWDFLRGRPELSTLVVMVGAMVGFVNLALVAEVVFAEGVLRAGAGGYAALVAAWTGAGVVGTLLAGRLPSHRLVTAALVATTCTGAGVVVASFAGHLWQAVIPYAFGGLANGVEVVATRSILNHHVPDRLNGRVFALYSALLFGASAVATGSAGALVGPLGARTVLFIAGAGGIAAGALGSVRVRRRMRALPARTR